MIRHKVCPTCGSRRIKLVTKDIQGLVGGKYPFKALAVVFHQCPKCGEELYSSEAMQKIESFWPAAAKRARRKAS